MPSWREAPPRWPTSLLITLLVVAGFGLTLFVFYPGVMTYDARYVYNAIAEGRVVRHFVTIPEGVTSEAVMETLMRADFLTGVAPAPPEGSVLPETYEAMRGDDRSAVLRRMMDARDRLLADLINAHLDVVRYAMRLDRDATLAAIQGKRHSEDGLQRVALGPARRRDIGFPA